MTSADRKNPNPVQYMTAGGQYEVTVPTVGDRVAQTVAALALEPRAESVFHKDSYGYRREPGGRWPGR